MSRPSTRTSTVLSGDKVFGPTDVVLVVPTNLRSHKTCNVTDVSQRAALAAVSGDLAAVAEMRPAFDRRSLVMHSMLNEIDRVTWILPEGAFQAFPSVQGLHGRDIRGRRSGLSSELADLAIEEAKVAVVPGEAGAPTESLRSFGPRRPTNCL